MNSFTLLGVLKNDSIRTRKENNTSMSKMLEWLWDVAVEPVLKELGFTDSPKTNADWPRVWWIPIGRLSLFPIHAAGYHSVKGQSTLDRVISSYTPTVKALDHARKQIERISKSSPQNVLLVSMPTTPNQSTLKFAAEEVEAINNFLPMTMRRIKSENPTKSEVIETIKKCSIVHFACHGQADPDPSKSRIILSDHSLSVSDIVQIKLDKAEFAYISACHAANNREHDLLDEAVHIGGSISVGWLSLCDWYLVAYYR